MQKTQSGQSYPNIGFDLQNDRGHEKNDNPKINVPSPSQ